MSDSGLPVLMYHFFYDKNKREPQDGNWIEINDFETQMKYLSENDFYSNNDIYLIINGKRYDIQGHNLYEMYFDLV